MCHHISSLKKVELKWKDQQNMNKGVCVISDMFMAVPSSNKVSKILRMKNRLRHQPALSRLAETAVRYLINIHSL